MKKQTSKTAGFSVIEVLITALMVIVFAAITLPLMQAGIREAKADAALNEAVAQLRLARNYAVDQRRIHRVTFIQPDQIQLERRELDSSWTSLLQVGLPGEMEFRIEGGAPTEEGETPDSLGVDAAVNFAGSNQVFFTPEGYATDATGQMLNGIAYLAVPGYLESSRAVTLFGGTGRARGWALRKSGETWAWD